MRERVVLKWGGGLITEKDTMKTVRKTVLDSLAAQLESCIREGIDVVLVHGAGSYGHMKAKAYNLADGKLPEFKSPDGTTQEEAVEAVREDMLELNQHVMDALTKYDVSAVSIPPHKWARNTGHDFEADLEMFASVPEGIVLVTHGDVVDCDEPQTFGILSGDDIVYRMATELPNVKRLVFAMGGVEGVLREPPTGDCDEASLIEVLHKEDVFSEQHMDNIDVTGGIALKVERGFQTAEHGISVHLVSGEIDERVMQACLGNEVRGTVLAL